MKTESQINLFLVHKRSGQNVVNLLLERPITIQLSLN